MAASDSPQRIMAVGFDAMDVELARQLADQGRLPTLKGLFEQSPTAQLENPRGFYAGGLWPSFWSGRTPAAHGRTCHVRLVPGTYEFRRTQPEEIEGTPFWKSVSDGGMRVFCMDIPFALPLDDVAGIQLIDWGSHDRNVEFQALPTNLQSAIEPHPIYPRCNTYAREGRWSELRNGLLEGSEARTSFALAQTEEDDFDLITIVYGESHCAGHQFWALHDPSHTNHDADLRQDLGDALTDVYEALDTQLGRLLDAVPDALTYVILSHGMGPHHNGDHLMQEVLRRLNKARANRPGSDLVARSQHKVRARIRPFIPRRYRRARYRRRFGGTTDGDRNRDDRAESFFFQHVNNTSSGVRLNLEGRDPDGKVSESDREDTLDWLIGQLCSLVDPETDQPVVTRVERTADLYEGPYVGQFPDLLVDWETTRPITAVSSPTIGRVTGEYVGSRSGDHRIHGAVAVTGPGSGNVSLEPSVPIVDLAPSIASHFGVELAESDGRPIAGLAAVTVAG